MTLKELKEIIDLFTSRDSLEELEVEKAGVRLRIRRSSGRTAPVSTTHAAPPPVSAAPVLAPVSAESEDLFYIKSPMVGTFYRAAAPTSDPYVSAGDIVEKGAVLCLIEAMKLMNEIESEVAGQIVSVLIENGQPVEYGERLFAIRPR
jgi:acetyl-CoA carboxylase biotin carboxyl carrier protein